ncbi:MAG: cation diffusion facilitator family transporter [Bryobacterales bacterium]|nr:cation diffusion facilitator family transporter [Bryobacteraceae bacterium]MDW8355304.1 cation diffusion facilitator family transporter [Bryobacterales bacterium]
MSAISCQAWRVALAGMGVSVALALAKIVIGLMAGSTAVVADGVESAGDVGASLVVLFGLWVAAKPPDANHPYGHGRLEILTGLVVGIILAAAGAVIIVRSLDRVGEAHEPPAAYAVWPLVASVALKSGLAAFKLRHGRRFRSSALVADAYNDLVDVLSGSVALLAVGLTLYDPARFLAADHYGGAAVGLIVIFTGLRVVRTTTLQLMDTMPDPGRMKEIRRVALSVPGVLGVEKCFARKTGFQYHVDLHLEVDPELTVRASHDIATDVRFRIRERLEWVADVLVHVEPFLPQEANASTPGHSSGPGGRPSAPGPA